MYIFSRTFEFICKTTKPEMQLQLFYTGLILLLSASKASEKLTIEIDGETEK